MNWLEEEHSQIDTPEYFEKQLDALDLSVRKIKIQSKNDLHRSLIVANDAIANHESFGKITVLIPAQGQEWSKNYAPPSRTETGILPFLLERKKLVVRVQDIVNTFRHQFYLVEGPGHREHLACKHAKKLVFSRILGNFCCALKFGSTNLFTMS